VLNFNLTDMRDWAIFTSVSLPIGYCAGALSQPSMRRPSMVVGGIIGGLAGLMWGIESSIGRLMGFTENTEEVKRMINKR